MKHSGTYYKRRNHTYSFINEYFETVIYCFDNDIQTVNKKKSFYYATHEYNIHTGRAIITNQNAIRKQNKQ